MKTLFLLAGIGLLTSAGLMAQAPASTYNANTRFEQLGTLLPTPTTTRTASGAPGKAYWQQRADYDIKVELDDAHQKITGFETVTYHNDSPDVLPYIWLQVEQNRFRADAAAGRASMSAGISENGMSAAELTRLVNANPKAYGYTIHAVKDVTSGKDLKFTVNETMMRVDLAQPVRPGQSVVFSVAWDFLIPAQGRCNYKYYPADGNYAYYIAQWFPRLAAYDDVDGWKHKQFMGAGEFTLIFGNYKVAITVPEGHVVAATGELQNSKEVLSPTQLNRWEEVRNSYKTPVLMVTQEEAIDSEQNNKTTGKKTWIFKADNVRDFTFASSRRFIWDAMNVDINGKKSMAMSYYPKESNPLWGQFSTQAVAHTLRSYGARTIPYPYPVAISVNSGAPRGGMEYPMISFNGGLCEADGTYDESMKFSTIGVIIHEVGHNFFPMIVNSDERQWAWMDEGINSFCEYLAEQEWDRNFPSSYGEPQQIVPYMKSAANTQVPIMSSSDNIMQYGANAYSKPAIGLNILRETIMGRELFDYAFKEYARRWAFKSPTPADFFRTMEDASGVDLDWFWKGWFYTVEPADQNLAEVKWYAISSMDPAVQKAAQKEKDAKSRQTMAVERNKTDIKQTVVEANPAMNDFYNNYDRYAATDAEKKKYTDFLAGLTEDEKKLYESGKNFYTLVIQNKGGLVMPVIVKADYEDGTSEVFRYPAEIWRMNDKQIQKVIPTDKKVKQWTLDPFFEIADIDTENNSYPKQPVQPTRFQMFKQNGGARRPGEAGLNPMQEQKKAQSGAVGGRNSN
ncbi:MAG: M1 family metallopeptidase [Siphonobacter sp.]